MTIQEAAKQAIEVQDACNLSGVLRAFQNIVSEVIWPEANRLGKGTDWVNCHPICVMFLSKLCSLNGGSSSNDYNEAAGTYDYMHASDECEKLSKETTYNANTSKQRN